MASKVKPPTPEQHKELDEFRATLKEATESDAFTHNILHAVTNLHKYVHIGWLLHFTSPAKALQAAKKLRQRSKKRIQIESKDLAEFAKQAAVSKLALGKEGLLDVKQNILKSSTPDDPLFVGVEELLSMPLGGLAWLVEVAYNDGGDAHKCYFIHRTIASDSHTEYERKIREAYVNDPKTADLIVAEVQGLRDRAKTTNLPMTSGQAFSFVKTMYEAFKGQCRKCHAKKEGLKACSGCKVAHYCNKQCQKADWESHKGQCAYERVQFSQMIIDAQFIK
jgi:hypothetical protein